MSEVTHIWPPSRRGDIHARTNASRVYDEVRKLAAQRLASETPGRPSTECLVHEAYLRLVDVRQSSTGTSREFISSPREARGHAPNPGSRAPQHEEKPRARRREESELKLAQGRATRRGDPTRILDLDSVLTILAAEDHEAALGGQATDIAGLSVEDAAQVLSTSRAHALSAVAYARAWPPRPAGEQPPPREFQFS